MCLMYKIVCWYCVRIPDVSLFVAARNMKNWRKTSARCRWTVPSPVLCTVFTRTTNCTSSRSPCRPPFPIPPSSWSGVSSGRTSPCTNRSDSAPGHIWPWYWTRTSPVQSRRTAPRDHRRRSRRKRDWYEELCYRNFSRTAHWLTNRRSANADQHTGVCRLGHLLSCLVSCAFHSSLPSDMRHSLIVLHNSTHTRMVLEYYAFLTVTGYLVTDYL